jgi:predicted dehydrogenase
MEESRRQFLAAGAAAVPALAAGVTRGAERGPLPVALVGAGVMGRGHLGLLARRDDLRVAWVCDVDAERRDAAAKIVTQAGKDAPRATADLREILADDAVRAVWIATPDHWHGPAAILAAAAGKHVYVEKPACHNLREGRLMVEAARRHGVVMQVGTQSRSTPTVRAAIDRMRSGAIGEVLVAKAWNSQLRRSIGRERPSDPPAGLDYDLWVGPAEWQPYRRNLLPGVWRFWRNFGCGDIGNDGVHEIDIARWGLGVDTHPDRAAGLGGKYFFDDDQEFPDTQYCVWEWPDPQGSHRRRQLVFEQRDWSPYVQEGYENGNAFYGTDGMLVLGKQTGWQLFSKRNTLVEEMRGSVSVPAHHDDFLDAVRGAEAGGPPRRTAADIEEGHRSAALVHLGNIACRTGRTLAFDAAAERIVGDPEADALLRRGYRAGHWAAPAGG